MRYNLFQINTDDDEQNFSKAILQIIDKKNVIFKMVAPETGDGL